MLVSRIILVMFVWVVATQADQRARDKVALHKAWLSKRAHLKELYAVQSSDSSPSTLTHLAYLKALAHRTPTPIIDHSRSSTANDILDNEVDKWPPITMTMTTTTTTTTPATTTTSSTTRPPTVVQSTMAPTTPTTTPTSIKTTPSNALHQNPSTSTSMDKTSASAGFGSSAERNHGRLHKPMRPYWGGWNRWSPCSRSCGAGVTTQTRHCYVRLHTAANASAAELLAARRPSAMCIGVHKRHRVCNEESCPDLDEDFRSTQCAQYNNVTFHGKQYDWEAYVKDDAECELNCKPAGMEYFALLDARVVDGTACAHPVDDLQRQRHRRRGTSDEAVMAGRRVDMAQRRAICVQGVCKAIHGGGVISATLMNEGTVRCGRLLCRPISGVFADNPLQEGYTLVATIPVGASNISITELRHSANRLAIRTPGEPFTINGDLDEPSSSGAYDLADALIDYRQLGADDPTDSNEEDDDFDRQRTTSVTEWLTSTGPITEPIEVMVLAVERNPGIRFEYLVPAVPTKEHLPPTSDEYSYEQSAESTEQIAAARTRSTSGTTSTSTTTTTTSTTTTSAPSTAAARPPPPSRRRRRFLWKVTEFAPCSKSCGGGFQTPVLRCVREAPLRFFVPRKCAHLPRPDAAALAQRCNTHACPGYWRLGEWQPEKCAECNGTQTQSSAKTPQLQRRDVHCVQELGSGLVIQIPAAACTEKRPPAEHSCPVCPTRAAAGPAAMLADQATGAATIVSRPAAAPAAPSAPHRVRRPHPHRGSGGADGGDGRERGVWLSSEWSAAECSSPASCHSGRNIEHRTIFCDRANKFTKRCELAQTPPTSRQCGAQTAAERCGEVGEWLVGDWSECGGDCFALTQVRRVVCVRGGAVAEAADGCRSSERPLAEKRCEAEEVAHCRPQWHYSAWSECSKPCDAGTQRRSVKCVRPIGAAMKESEGCKFVDRRPIFQACNVHACEVIDNTANEVPSALTDSVQNDTDTECIDKLQKCDLVQKQHLCSTSYFADKCCYTCTKQHN